VAVLFAVIGLRLIIRPESFLAQLDRPATQKHVRATRIIGLSVLLFVGMALVSWLRHPR
jgi:hypothetical protein